MKQDLSFIRISELMKMAKASTVTQRSDSDQTLALIDQLFRSIDRLSIDRREAVMRSLTSWMLVERFEAKGHAALVGIQEYCIADCFYDDPSWSPPDDVLILKQLPDAY